MLNLQTIFHNQSLALSDVIIKSMEIVSDLTNYTSIVLGSSSNQNKISKVEVVPVSQTNLVAIVITDKGHVEHKNMQLEERVSLSEIKQTVDLINKFIIGTPLNEVSMKLEYEVKPKIASSLKEQQAIYEALYNAFNEFKTEEENMVKVNKPSNILKEPEFDDTSKMRSILKKFEDKELIKNIEEQDSGINVYIGSESEFDDDVSIIKTKYNIDGEEGTIALIGPKRMEYDRVMTLLKYIKDNIEEIE